MFAKFCPLLFYILLMAMPATVCRAKELRQPAITDFQYVYPLDAPHTASLYRVKLPLHVYMLSQLPQLRDVRVFDSSGTPMPYFITEVADTVTDEEHTYPAFPVRVAEEGRRITLLGGGGQGSASPEKQAPAPASGSTRREADALLFDFAKPQHGLTNLQLIPEAPLQPAPDTPNASADSQPAGHAGVISVTLFTSSDMVSWREAARGTIGSISAANQQLELLALHLNTQDRYALLLPAPGAILFKIQGVAGKKKTRRQQNFAEYSITGWQDEDARGYAYAVPPSLPVRAISLKMPEEQWFARTEVLTRTPRNGTQHNPQAAQGEWRLRTTALFFQAQVDGGLHTNEPVTFNPAWLRVDTRPNLLLRPQGTLWKQAPQLRVHYEMQYLYFLATGRGPFRLAVGTSLDLAGASDPAVKQTLQQNTATELYLGLVQKQATSSHDKTGQTVLIWGGLLLGALCMGGIALQMLRAQRATKE